MVPDENSMEDPLCNSSFGSMVSLDCVTPDTFTEPLRRVFCGWQSLCLGWSDTCGIVMDLASPFDFVSALD